MQKNIARIFLVGFLAIAIGLVGFSETVDAKSTRTKTKNSGSEKTVLVKVKVKTAAGKIKRVKAKKRTIPGKMVGVPVALTEAEKIELADSSSAGATDKIIFKKGNTNYTAYITASTSIVDRKGGSLVLGDFKNSQKISVRGSVVGNKIYKVTKLRNVALPIVTTEVEDVD